MEHKELKKRAVKKVRAKKSFIIIATLYAVISFLLIVISLKIGGEAAFWIRFPIFVFMAVLTVIYVSVYGLPGTPYWNDELREEEVAREMLRLRAADDNPMSLDLPFRQLSYREEDMV